MLTKKEIRNIIEKIAIILNNEYIKEHPHHVVTEKELKMGYKSKWTKKHCEYKDYIACGDGNFIALTEELEQRKAKLTLQRMLNVYTIRNELLNMLITIVNDQFAPFAKDETSYADNKIMEIRRWLELGLTNNTIITAQHEKMHSKQVEAAFRSATSFLNEWTPKSQTPPQIPQASQALPPPYSTSKDSIECKNTEPMQHQSEFHHTPTNAVPTLNEIRNIIKEIAIILNNGYMKEHAHHVVTEKELQMGYKTKWTKKHCEYKDYIYCKDEKKDKAGKIIKEGNFIALTEELEHRDVKLTLKRMLNVYTMRNELLNMLITIVNNQFSPLAKDEISYAQGKIMEIRRWLELGVTHNTILTIQHEKVHLKPGESCEGKFWVTTSLAEAAFQSAISFLIEWKPKSQTLPQTPQIPSASQVLPPPYSTSKTVLECKNTEPLQYQAPLSEQHDAPRDKVLLKEQVAVGESLYQPTCPTLFTPKTVNPAVTPSAPVLSV